MLRESYKARAGADPDRHRLGGAPLHRGRGPARGRRDRHARGVDALLDRFAEQDEALPRHGPAALRARAGVGGGRRHAGLGALGRRRTATRSACPASAPRRRQQALYEHFGFTPENIAEQGKKVVEATQRERSSGETWQPRHSQRAARGAHRGGHERLARPDPAQPDRVGRARSAWCDEDSLRGVTSNPAIFEKAILGSDDYDDDIERLAGEGLDAEEIYVTLAINDVQLACDVLRPVYDETGGVDGYVSLEVEPSLAHDTEGTLEQAARALEARRPPQRDDQDPGHRRGPAGDRAGDRRGHQRERDAAVLGRGLRARGRGASSRASERRQRPASRSTCTRSRASSSRAWTPRSTSGWRSSGREDLHGTAAVANAQAAYQSFKEIFHGERFADAARGRRAGAAAAVGLDRASRTPSTPRPSTSTSWSPRDTVNTMPMPTLLAAGGAGRGHGRRRPTRTRPPSSRPWPTPASTWTT